MAEGYGNISPDKREHSTCEKCGIRFCKECGIRPASKCGIGKNGKTYYRPECGSCFHKRYGIKDKRTNRQKDPWKNLSYQIRQEVGRCEKCLFEPEHLGQLDVDHVDGNPKNNDRKNLQVLCANCHRLKTILSGDGLNKKPYKQKVYPGHKCLA